MAKDAKEFTLSLRHIQDRCCVSCLVHDCEEGRYQVEYSLTRLRLYLDSFHQQTFRI